MEDSATQTAPPPSEAGCAPPTISQLARLAHETNRAYCESIDDFSQPDWANAPEWQRKSALEGVRYHVTELNRSRQPSPAESHNRWLEGKRADGWKFGPIKDPEKKEHPCFLPFAQLPFEQKLKDYLFGAIIRACVQCIRDCAAPDPPTPPQ